MTEKTKLPRILIVDDDALSREILAERLEFLACEPTAVAGGRELFERIEEIDPDVILLDVMMPEIDGLSVCRQLKSDPRWRHVPIILVTALNSREDLIRGLDTGADEFLSKPVNGEELRARIRSMLRIKYQYDELQQLLTLREDLVNMMVHDLRNPLATIVIYHGLLRLMGQLSGRQLEALDVIQNQAQRLESLLNDMLILAKMRHGALTLNRDEVDVVALIEQVRHLYSHQATSVDKHLEIEIGEGGQLVSLDSNLFRRILDNLYSNALKYSAANTTVIIRILFSSEMLLVEVIDEGIGIPADKQQQIFEKFATGQTLEEVSQVGLGLAFCKLAVEAHDGLISLRDNEPKGSIFSFQIPLNAPPVFTNYSTSTPSL